MKSEGVGRVTQALIHADEQGVPAAIFALVPERDLWTHCEAILDDPEQSSLFGPSLICGIGAALPQIQDQAAGGAVLLHVLRPTVDSLVFEAAQRAILSHAQSWNAAQSRQFWNAFADAYALTVIDGDPFVAAMALEGTVMLPIHRADAGLLLRATGVLVTDFPPIPDDPRDPAFLPVKALKLLGRCYDRKPDDAVADHVRSLVGSHNRAVDSEARFNLGLVRLYDAFRAPTEVTFQDALIEARKLFQAASASEEGRSDAELFAAITACFEVLSTGGPLAAVSDLVSWAKEVLTERLLAFGGAVSESQAMVERQFVRLVAAFDHWATQLTTLHQQPDLALPMYELASAYAAVRALESTQGLLSGASNAAHVNRRPQSYRHRRQ